MEVFNKNITFSTLIIINVSSELNLHITINYERSRGTKGWSNWLLQIQICDHRNKLYFKYIKLEN